MKHSPKIMMITCADARLEPNQMIGAEVGDVFTYRNVGNYVEPNCHESIDVAAAIDFAITGLKIPHIVVCGHTDCGAIKSAMDKENKQEPYLEKWLNKIRRETINQSDNLTQLSEQNVIQQLINLQNYPIVLNHVNNGTLEINAWMYNIVDKTVFEYNKRKYSFSLLTDFRMYGIGI